MTYKVFKVYATLMGSVEVRARDKQEAEELARQRPIKDFEFEWETTSEELKEAES